MHEKMTKTLARLSDKSPALALPLNLATACISKGLDFASAVPVAVAGAAAVTADTLALALAVSAVLGRAVAGFVQLVSWVTTL